MHVLYLHQHFVARSGSSGGRSYEMSRRLVQSGHRVTLISGAHEQAGLSAGQGRWWNQIDLDGIDLWVVNVPYRQEMSPRRRMVAFLHFMLCASWLSLRVRDADLVFATSTPLTIAVPGILAALYHRKPFVLEVRDLWPEIPIRLGVLKSPATRAAARLLEQVAYRVARHIIALSPGMKGAIVAAGVSTHDVTVIPNSSDLDLFRVDPELGRRFRAERPEIADRPLLVYAGALGRVNGLDYLVRLAAAVRSRDPRVRFLLVGQGSEKEKIRELAKSLGVLDETLFFHRPVSRDELPAILSAATVLSSFVKPLPILDLNSANKFFDAFAAGKPIVINYGGWQAETLAEHGAGLALDPEDIESAATRLVDALGDAAWLRSAAVASARLGEQVFSREELARAFEEVLIRVSGSR